MDILRGAPVTAEMTATTLALSCMLGLLVGTGWLNPRRRFTYGICMVYVTFTRDTSLLVQLFLLFFGLPQFDILLSAFVCGVLGLSVYSGVYVSEIVCDTIQLVDRGQMEAIRLADISSAQSIRTVILPQAMVRIIPPLGNEFAVLIKNPALVSLLMTHDLMHEGQKIISVSYRSLEVHLTIALMYLVLTSATSYLLHRLERNIRARGMVQ